MMPCPALLSIPEYDYQVISLRMRATHVHSDDDHSPALLRVPSVGRPDPGKTPGVECGVVRRVSGENGRSVVGVCVYPVRSLSVCCLLWVPVR